MHRYMKLFTWKSFSIESFKCWILPCKVSICSLPAVIFSCMSTAAWRPEAETNPQCKETKSQRGRKRAGR